MSEYNLKPEEGASPQSLYRSVLAQARNKIFKSHQSITDVCFPCGGHVPDLKNLSTHGKEITVHSIDLNPVSVTESRLRAEDYPSVHFNARCGNVLEEYSFPVGPRPVLCNFFSLTTFDPKDYEVLLNNAMDSVPPNTPLYFLFHDVTGSRFSASNPVYKGEVEGARFVMNFPKANNFDSNKITKEWCFNQGMFSLAATGKDLNYYCLDIDSKSLPPAVKPALQSLCLVSINSSQVDHVIPGWKLRGAPSLPPNAATDADPRYYIDLTQVPIYLPGSSHTWNDDNLASTLKKYEDVEEDVEGLETVPLEPKGFRSTTPEPRGFEDLAFCYFTMPGSKHKIDMQTFLNQPLPLSDAFNSLPLEIEEYIEGLHVKNQLVPLICKNCSKPTKLIVAMRNPHRAVDYCYPCVGYYTEAQLKRPDPIPRETERIVNSGIRGGPELVRALKTSTARKTERMQVWEGGGTSTPFSPLHQHAGTSTKVPGLFVMSKKHFPPVPFNEETSGASVESHHTRTAYHWGHVYSGANRGFSPGDAIQPPVDALLRAMEKGAGIQEGLFNQATYLVYHPTDDKTRPQHLVHHRDAKGLCGPILVQNGDNAALLQMKDLNSDKEYNFQIGPGDSYLMTGIAITHFSHAVSARNSTARRTCIIARHIGESDDIASGKNMRVEPSAWLSRDEMELGIPATVGSLLRNGKRYGGRPPPLTIPIGQSLPKHRVTKAPLFDNSLFTSSNSGEFVPQGREEWGCALNLVGPKP